MPTVTPFSETALTFVTGSDEKIYSYTVITTSSNPYLKFLHDRMPVVLEPGSTAMATWLDPRRTTWSKELQSLLKPYEGELECYPVSKEVGKVGNNSPDFIVPINSKENKKNIANFFTNAPKNRAKKGGLEDHGSKSPMEARDSKVITDKPQARHEQGEDRETQNRQGNKDNLPPIIPNTKDEMNSLTLSPSIKRRHSPDGTGTPAENDQKPLKMPRQVRQPSPEQNRLTHSPLRASGVGNKKTRRSTSNATLPKLENSKKAGRGTQRITNFFKK